MKGETLDAKLLVVSADGSESDLPAIKQALDYLGTPYTLWVATQNPGALTSSVLSSGNHGNYQGVIFATADLGMFTANGWGSALTTDELAAVESYEAAFGVRHLNWYAFPTPSLGFSTWGAGTDTTTAPVQVTATSAGQQVFSYLNTSNPLSIRNVWAYLAPAASDPSVTPLLVDGAGNAIALEMQSPDGRDSLTVTVDGNQYLTHTLVLSYGLINWVTKGVFIGERHSYVGAQIDDLFLASDMWDLSPDYRMSPADLDAAYAWQTAHNADPATATLRLAWAFSGAGAWEDGAPSDPLASEAIMLHDGFEFISHTYTHPDSLSPMPYEQVTYELMSNLTAEQQFNFGGFSAAALVTPGVSGLDMAASMQAIYDAGVRYVVSDTSQPGQDNPSPNAGIYNSFQPSVFEIRRRATNLFYNVWTPEQWAGEYNALYRSYWGRDLTVAEIVDKESDMLLLYMLRWEMDPWMFHQANLGLYDGQHALLTDLIDAAIAKYKALVTTPLLTLPMGQLGEQMASKMTLNQAGVSGVITPGVSISVTVQNGATVPITGVDTGGAESYGGQSISHVALTAGQTVTIPL